MEVSSEQFDQAGEALSKLELGQRSIDEIRKTDGSTSFWDGPGEREQKEKLKLEEMLERLISDQEGVLWVVVRIDRPRPSAFARNNPKPTAFVYVETDGGRALPYRTIQAIPTILSANVRDLAPESITVMDRRGNPYLESGNLTLGDNSRNRAREQEISEEIQSKLDWINGVRVQVHVEGAHAGYSPPAAVARAKTNGLPALPLTASQFQSGSHEQLSNAAQPKMAVNQPLELDGDRESGSTQLPPPTADGVAAKAASSPHASQAPSEPGRVVIRVPRALLQNADPQRRPCSDARRAKAHG